jgi:hypothetical protein
VTISKGHGRLGQQRPAVGQHVREADEDTPRGSIVTTRGKCWQPKAVVVPELLVDGTQTAAAGSKNAQSRPTARDDRLAGGSPCAGSKYVAPDVFGSQRRRLERLCKRR